MNQDLPTILVIEDEDGIQAVIEDALTDAGFLCAIAASGEEAVTLLRADRTKYRGVVTDIGLRGTIDGWAVARKAREIDPEFPVVYIGRAVRNGRRRACPTASCCKSRSLRLSWSRPLPSFSTPVRRFRKRRIERRLPAWIAMLMVSGRAA